MNYTSSINEITRNARTTTTLLGRKHQASIVVLLCYFGSFEKTKKDFTFEIRKTLVQVLVLSKLYVSGIVYHNLPDYLANRLQRIRKASARFVLGPYAITDDVTKLKWLVHSPTWPSYLKVDIVKHTRTLRSSSGTSLVSKMQVVVYYQCCVLIG